MARPCTKVDAAVDIIRKRILHGDHVIHGIPGERRLSAEIGISRETLRRAIGRLRAEGILQQQPGGRLEVGVGVHFPRSRRNIGFVKYSSPSHDIQLWQEGVYAAMDGQNGSLRTVTFEHYGDSAISAALEGFDGVFFLPPAEKIPDWLARRMKDAPCRVVVLDQDATDAGLPSVVMFPPRSEQKLLEHLMVLGHRQIDCLSTQARDPVIEARIATWRSFLKDHQLAGKLHVSAELRPIASAYRLVREQFIGRSSKPSAVICTTGPAALGAMRAFYDQGIRVGRDISICAVNDEGLGPFLTPSLTSLQSPPRALYLQTAVQWLTSEGNQTWPGELLVEPCDVPVFIGDSTSEVLIC